MSMPHKCGLISVASKHMKWETGNRPQTWVYFKREHISNVSIFQTWAYSKRQYTSNVSILQTWVYFKREYSAVDKAGVLLRATWQWHHRAVSVIRCCLSIVTCSTATCQRMLWKSGAFTFDFSHQGMKRDPNRFLVHLSFLHLLFLHLSANVGALGRLLDACVSLSVSRSTARYAIPTG